MGTSPVFVSFLFGVSYLGLAIGRLPGLFTDRAGIALCGAATFLAFGSLSFDDAAGAIDSRTIALLFGMMVVVAHLKLSGFFSLVTQWVASRAHRSTTLLASLILVAGVLSAFLVNDVVCLALTPLVLDLCERLRRSPVPFLIGLATASNIGSVATITGNPQNMIIGSLSDIPYLRFSLKLAPIAALGLLADYAVLAWVYRRELAARDLPEFSSGRRSRVHRGLLFKSLLVTAIAVVLFFAGAPIGIVALAAAGLLMLERLRPQKIYASVDWRLLVLFCGLFVVTRAFEMHVAKGWNLEQLGAWFSSPIIPVSLLSVALSNLVSNVPAVLLFKPILVRFPVPVRETAWLALSMSATLAGNLTLLGSVANLIVVEGARRARIELSFREYLKVGVPVTLITLALGVGWLLFLPY
jgi:Na+/H+ antiporter NhaD/arsenite permease-like protein